MTTELIVETENVHAFRLACRECDVVIKADTYRKDGNYHVMKIEHQLKSHLFAVGLVTACIAAKQFSKN